MNDFAYKNVSSSNITTVWYSSTDFSSGLDSHHWEDASDNTGAPVYPFTFVVVTKESPS